MDQKCQTSWQHCDIRPHRKWRNHSETKWFYWAREQCNFELQTCRHKCVFKRFMSQCCHLFGSQTWQLDSKSITGFSTAWHKAIRKLWCLPNTTRSDIVPYLVGAPPLEEQLFRRIAKMCNNIHKCCNSKMLKNVLIPKLLAPDGVAVLNICNVTIHLIIPGPSPELLQLKSSWTIIFLVSPQMKLQISLLTVPATKCNKHVVNNHCVISITSCYVCIFSFFCVYLFVHLFLCSVLRVRTKYICAYTYTIIYLIVTCMQYHQMRCRVITISEFRQIQIKSIVCYHVNELLFIQFALNRHEDFDQCSTNATPSGIMQGKETQFCEVGVCNKLP